MLRFVIGVDSRTGSFGAEIERALRCIYDLAEFEVVGIPCGLPRDSFRALELQAECILEALLGFPARYYIGISSGRILEYTPSAIIPMLTTVITAIDSDGVVWVERTEHSGHYMPMKERGYTDLPRQPDLLDLVQALVVDLAGTQSEPLPVF